MSHSVDAEPPFSHLLHIETHVQADPDVDYGYSDVETVPLNSLEDVREEVRRRYRDLMPERLVLESTSSESTIGAVYEYTPVDESGQSQHSPHRDYVRVYELPNATVDPDLWKSMPEIKESHLEEELADALQSLLDCPDLNLDDKEPDTVEAIARAHAVLAQREQLQQ